MPKRGVTSDDQEKFEHFLFEMDDVLESYVVAAVEQGYGLDYSLESLVELERYWQATGDGQRDGTDANRAARYLGERTSSSTSGSGNRATEDDAKASIPLNYDSSRVRWHRYPI